MLAGDRVSGTDADRHEDISHNVSSGFGDNADSATADLSPCPINAQIAALLFMGHSHRLSKKCTHCHRRSGVTIKREATLARTHATSFGSRLYFCRPLFRRRPPSARITSDA